VQGVGWTPKTTYNGFNVFVLSAKGAAGLIELGKTKKKKKDWVKQRGFERVFHGQRKKKKVQKKRCEQNQENEGLEGFSWA